MLKKNLHLCFSRIQCLPSSFSHQLTFDAEEDSDNSTTTTTNTNTFSSSTTSSDSETTTDPDFSSVFASRRFFVSSPGTSNSILDPSTKPSPASISPVVVEGGVPVRKYSPDPYMDFRTSMEEMVRARRELLHPTAVNQSSSSSSANASTDWDYLHELLLCYLSLNPKHTHKFIVGAFTDLLLSLMSSASGGILL